MVIDAIARESAAVFSVRTFGTTDEEWATVEGEYLADWLKKFPTAIWWAPPSVAAGTLPSTKPHDAYGYFSVIVPVVEESYQMILRGI